MFASKGFRSASLFACVVMVLSMVSVDQAEARRGGSFGSRGTRTFQTAPATPTSPGVTAPIQRSTTPAQQTNAAPRAGTGAPQASFLNGFGGSLMRGLFLGGLLGLMFGQGFGGIAGFLGLLVQIVLIAVVIRLAMGAFARRSQPAATGGGLNAGRSAFPQGMPMGGGMGRAIGRTRTKPRQPDEIGTTQADLDQFERILGAVQTAYGRRDQSAMQRLVTPEMMNYFTQELEDFDARGHLNQVSDVKLLQGDVSESWREGNAEYATAAMRYQSIEVTRDRSSGAVVSGDPDQPSEVTELWTFVRNRGGAWTLSAIQEA